MSKIGIMGGTFNPIHRAHVEMGKACLDQQNLDKVLFMPSKNPPHKEKRIYFLIRKEPIWLNLRCRSMMNWNFPILNY